MCCQLLHTIELVSNSCSVQCNNNKCACLLLLFRVFSVARSLSLALRSISFIVALIRFLFTYYERERERESECARGDVYFIPSSFTELVKSSQPPIQLYYISSECLYMYTECDIEKWRSQQILRILRAELHCSVAKGISLPFAFTPNTLFTIDSIQSLLNVALLWWWNTTANEQKNSLETFIKGITLFAAQFSSIPIPNGNI